MPDHTVKKSKPLKNVFPVYVESIRYCSVAAVDGTATPVVTPRHDRTKNAEKKERGLPMAGN